MTNRYVESLVCAVALSGLMIGCSGAVSDEASTVSLESEEQKTLYALGLSMGSRLPAYALSPEEIEIVKAGLTDAASGATPRVEMQTYLPKIHELAQARAALVAKRQKAESEAIVEKLAGADGAESSASGMIYIERRRGTGASPKPTDTVRAHYAGTLLDGTEFDSSYKRGEPIDFALNRVIPCWTEGLQKMAIGGKAQLVCPSDIAYGDAGRPGSIPPGATLLFEVELVGINMK